MSLAHNMQENNQFRSKLAMGNFSGVDTKYEHQVERATKQSKDILGVWMFSSSILVVPSGFLVT